MPKRKYCLVPSEREKECYNHTFFFTGGTPGTGSEQCMYCGTKRRGYVGRSYLWEDANGNWTNKCPTCNRMRVQPDPTKHSEEITDSFPEWACSELWCGHEIGIEEWSPKWQSDVLI